VLHCSSTELAQQVLSRVHSGPQPNQAGEWNPFELLSNQGVSARLMDERVVVITAMAEELELSQAADGRSLAVAEWQQAWDRQSRAPFRLLLTKEGLRTWSGKAGQPPQAGKSGEPQLRPEWQELMADLERVSGLADVFLISGVGPEGNALELAVVPAEGTTGWEVDFATQSVLRNLGHRFHGWARDARSQAGADSPLGDWLEQLANGLKSSAAQEPQSVSGARIWRGPVNGMDQPGRRAWQEQWDDSQSPVAARVLAKALQRFHDSHGRWPSAMERRTPSEPPHSWRVALLPHLGMNELYESYQFDKSWDDPANRHVLARMPDCFLAVGSPRSSTRWIMPQASGPTGGPGSVDESVPPGSEFLLVATPKVAIPWTMPETEPCDERLLDLIRRDGAHAVLLTGEQELRRYHFQPGAGGIR
ncbi:MAG: DUF1559 domain-containing protein, partial [Planctomycetaceae bacterium]